MGWGWGGEDRRVSGDNVVYTRSTLPAPPPAGPRTHNIRVRTPIMTPRAGWCRNMICIAIRRPRDVMFYVRNEFRFQSDYLLIISFNEKIISK